MINKKIFPVLLFFAGFVSFACATITVNVYFPAEEVRQAYTVLEDEFMIEDPGESGSEELRNKRHIFPDTGNLYAKEPVIKITRIVPITQKIDLNIVKSAVAISGNIAQQLEDEMRKFPEVIEAFRSRSERQAQVISLLDSGKIGEANNGKLVEREELAATEKQILEAENKDRRTIIEGMAKAIIKINNLEVTSSNVQRVYPEAAEQFATTRRDQAKSGWKVQLPDGRWAVKR